MKAVVCRVQFLNVLLKPLQMGVEQVASFSFDVGFDLTLGPDASCDVGVAWLVVVGGCSVDDGDVFGSEGAGVYKL